ncbi:MAG TPA: hypothetical protein VF599_04795 [Pyrinomonadaceae bacterium]|jgi:hypothetical protein
MDDWRDLARQGKFAEAEAAMLAETERETGYGDEVTTRAGFYEDRGDTSRGEEDKDKAKGFYEKALGGFRLFASWATSGGEGNARMLDVRRVEKKIADLKDAD